MKRNLDAPEQKPDCSNHINGAHIPSFFNPILSNSRNFLNGFSDVSAFNQHLISNLTTSLFMEQHNVWSKLISDLGLGSSFINQNYPLLDSNLRPCEEKRKKNSFTISDLIQNSDDLPLNIRKEKNEINSHVSKLSPETTLNIRKKEENEYVNKECNLIESKLRLPLKYGY